MPDSIGRYRVDRRLGSGAFATVWLAFDDSLDAQLAIKVLAENWMHDDDVRRRFSEEARILWRLDSERIIRVHAVDELPDGRPYFVMDYADGGNLADRMSAKVTAGQPFEIAEAVDISIAIAEGLAVAHGRGIVHRDLKPSNVMFRRSSDGAERVVLADFGIARSLESAGNTTISAGTPHYMAPEQSEGRADRGSDVYAAAVVLYELLAGVVPFPFPSAGQVMRAQLTSAAPDVRARRPEVPAGLAAAVALGLQSDPAHRYATAEAWRDAVRAGAAGEEPPGGFPPPPVPTPIPDAGLTMGPAELASARATGQLPLPPVPGVGPTPPPGSPPPGSPPPPPTGGPPGGPPPPRRKKRKTGAWLLGSVALIAVVALVAAIALVSGGKASADELYRDPAASEGVSPFMGSLVQAVKQEAASVPTDSASVPQLTLPPLTLPTSFPPGVSPPPSVPTGSVSGTTPGLYGGTRQLSVCDAKAMVTFLQTHADKAAAWAGALGIGVDQIASYTEGLTDAIIRSDTRVTNHSFVNGVATPHQSVLQAGTAVLVDALGVPRVRCYCGNPLLPPHPVRSRVRYTGPEWEGFSPTNITVIIEGPRVDKLVLTDVVKGGSFRRAPGPNDWTDVVATPGSTSSTSTSPSSTSTSATTSSSTTVTSPPNTAPRTLVNVTSQGGIGASSVFSSQFDPYQAVDGDPTTSWFSRGNADGNVSTFTWRGPSDMFIGRITVVGNRQNANPSFRRGQGFHSTRVDVLNSAGTVVFSQTYPGPGDSAASLTATPNVMGRTVKLNLIGHENPQCGGFSELKVEAA